jgi:pilus assembly protein Flp/PilA
MEKMWTLIKKFVKEEEGTETVEWAIVAGLVILAAAALWATIGDNVQSIISGLASSTTNAAT